MLFDALGGVLTTGLMTVGSKGIGWLRGKPGTNYFTEFLEGAADVAMRRLRQIEEVDTSAWVAQKRAARNASVASELDSMPQRGQYRSFSANSEAGIGGVSEYVSSSPSPSMVNQEENHSCAAACIRQYLLDQDPRIDIPESEIRPLARYAPDLGGIRAERAAPALEKLLPNSEFYGGGVHPDTSISALNATGTWMARLGLPTGAHWVLVDGFNEAGLLRIRDPWGIQGPGSGMGLEATMNVDKFRELWGRGVFHVVYRVK